MKFAYAKVYRTKIEYYKDSMPDVKYVMTFITHAALHEWMAKHEDCTITQMLIRYEYPKESNGYF